MLPHLSGVPHLHVNRPFRTDLWSQGIEERVPQGEEGFNLRFKILPVSGILTFLLCVNQTVAMDTNLKGRDSYASKRGTLSSEQMVLSLLESYENNGHVVYMKIFYSSPNLYLQLQKKVVEGCVTILATRKQMPQDMLSKHFPLERRPTKIYALWRPCCLCLA